MRAINNPPIVDCGGFRKNWLHVANASPVRPTDWTVVVGLSFSPCVDSAAAAMKKIVPDCRRDENASPSHNHPGRHANPDDDH